MVSKTLIVVAILFGGCFDVTNTIAPAAPNIIRENSFIKECNTPKRVILRDPFQNLALQHDDNKSLSFSEFYNYIGLLEHDNNPKKLLHKNVGEYSYTIYGVYPYTKLSCAKQIERVIRAYNTLVGKSLAIAQNRPILKCIELYYRNIYQRLKLSKIPYSVAKLYGAFYVHIGNLKKAKELLEASNNNINEFRRLTILYYIALKRKRYLQGWVNRVFK